MRRTWGGRERARGGCEKRNMGGSLGDPGRGRQKEHDHRLKVFHAVPTDVIHEKTSSK